MHPHRPDAGHARLYVGSAHARHARLADVRTQPAADTHRIGVGRRDENLAYRMRGGDILLLRCGREAHFGSGKLRGNEALHRLVGVFRRLTGSKVRR